MKYIINDRELRNIYEINFNKNKNFFNLITLIAIIKIIDNYFFA